MITATLPQWGLKPIVAAQSFGWDQEKKKNNKTRRRYRRVKKKKNKNGAASNVFCQTNVNSFVIEHPSNKPKKIVSNSSKGKCWFKNNCRRKDCHFDHPFPCRSGAKCDKKFCKFEHLQAQFHSTQKHKNRFFEAKSGTPPKPESTKFEFNSFATQSFPDTNTSSPISWNQLAADQLKKNTFDFSPVESAVVPKFTFEQSKKNPFDFGPGKSAVKPNLCPGTDNFSNFSTNLSFPTTAFPAMLDQQAKKANADQKINPFSSYHTSEESTQSPTTSDTPFPVTSFQPAKSVGIEAPNHDQFDFNFPANISRMFPSALEFPASSVETTKSLPNFTSSFPANSFQPGKTTGIETSNYNPFNLEEASEAPFEPLPMEPPISETCPSLVVTPHMPYHFSRSVCLSSRRRYNPVGCLLAAEGGQDNVTHYLDTSVLPEQIEIEPSETNKVVFPEGWMVTTKDGPFPHTPLFPLTAEDLSITCHGHKVSWPGRVVLNSLDELQTAVKFTEKNIDILPDATTRTPLGSGLNRTMRLVMGGVGKGRDPGRMETKLRRLCETEGTRFVDFRDGNWTFEVPGVES